jgi:phosphatidylglycerol---prolipoprotein diacylglyceryl transferase
MFDIAMEGFSIGPVTIRFYSLMILGGILAGAWLARIEARRRGMDPEHVWNILFWGAIGALIGARLYHVLDTRNIGFYLENPELIFAIWRGGIGIFGAVVGAALALIIYTRVKGLPTLHWLDVGAPAFLLGQAIGRWGNFFNRELFGLPSDLPWAIPIPQEILRFQAPQYLGETHFHPLFLYESLLSLLGVIVLVYIARRFGQQLKPGDIFLLYLVWYPATRFSLEFLRIDRWEAGGIPVAQIISLTLILVALGVFIWRHRDGWKVTGQEQPVPTQARNRARRRRS